MKKTFSIIALSLLISISQASDILITTKPNLENTITQKAYPELKLPENIIVNTVATMLTQFLPNANYLVEDDEIRNTLKQQGIQTAGADASCEKFAIELHFDPNHLPDGEGEGLWIATNNKEGKVIANQILQKLKTLKVALYRDQVLDKPTATARKDCPVLYINLDTHVEEGKRLWFIQPQAIMNYSQKLAKGLNAT